jgi:hypothetical protein
MNPGRARDSSLPAGLCVEVRRLGLRTGADHEHHFSVGNVGRHIGDDFRGTAAKARRSTRFARRQSIRLSGPERVMPIISELRNLTPGQRNAVIASFIGGTLNAFNARANRRPRVHSRPRC